VGERKRSGGGEDWVDREACGANLAVRVRWERENDMSNGVK
jgi:hypothetical protein